MKTLYQESNQYYNRMIDKEDMHFNPIKISHKIDTKPNRQLFNEQIKGFRKIEGKNYVIEKISDIYNSKENIKLIEDILNDNCEKYFIAKNDPRTFDIIKNIVLADFEIYKDNKDIYKIDKNKIKYVNAYKADKETKEIRIKNPLTKFFEENGPVTKFSPKRKGPPIKSMKYKGKILNEHVEAVDRTQNKLLGARLTLKPYRTDFYRCEDGKIRFVTVRHVDVEYKKSDGMYHIDNGLYNELLNKKKIGSQAEFLFSLHTDELLYIKKEIGESFCFSPKEKFVYKDSDYELFTFLGTNNDVRNVIEVKPRYVFTKTRINPYTTTFVECKKYATDVLGNLYEVKDSSYA